MSSLPMGNGVLAIHCMQWPLNKLSSVVDCDEEPTETSASGAQLAVSLDCYGSNNDDNDCGSG